MKRYLPFILLALLLALSACSLAADVTPPPGYQPAPAQAQPEQISGPLYPPVAPDPANGAPIYAEKCAPCHGDGGRGDGSQGLQLPNPPAALADAELARQRTPSEWYAIVTQGNMERFMPPFNSLSDRERWDVVAYSFSLGLPEARLAQGREVFEANCAGCHGPTGQGNGPEAAGLAVQPGDFANPEFMAAKTTSAFYEAISQGMGEAMPAFTQLSEEDRWAASEYVRWLTFAAGQAGELAGQPAGTPQPAVTEEPAATAVAQAEVTPELSSTEPVSGTLDAETASVGVVQGQVTNASEGDPAPGAEVTLHGFDQMTLATTLTTTVGVDGVYAFEDVEMPEGRAFLVTLEYQGATYGSDLGMVQGGSNRIDLPVTVYDTTTDVSLLSVDRLHLFFEFIDAQTVRVIELFIVNNPSKMTVVSAGEGQPTLTYSLPEGYSNLQFQEGAIGDRYVETPEGFGDTLAIRPGAGNYQVLFSYDMPYDKKLELRHPVQLPVNAVVILAPEGSVEVKGENLQDAGIRPVEGAQYHMYNGSSLPAGGMLALTVTGRPASGNTPLTTTGTSTEILVGLGALGVVLIGAGVWLYRRNRIEDELEDEDELEISEEEDDDAETLMDAILNLDDRYQAGEISEEAYRQRRAELKDRLRARQA